MKGDDSQLIVTARLPLPLKELQRQLQRSSVTMWRWRKLGWLETVNLAGKVYIMPEALDKFMCRLRAGDFAKDAITPSTSRGTSKPTGTIGIEGDGHAH